MQATLYPVLEINGHPLALTSEKVNSVYSLLGV